MRAGAGGAGPQGGAEGLHRISPLPQVVPDGCLVQALALVQKAGDLLGCVLQKLVLHQELDPLVGGDQVSALRRPDNGRFPPPAQKPQQPNPAPYHQSRAMCQASPRSLNTIPLTSRPLHLRFPLPLPA